LVSVRANMIEEAKGSDGQSGSKMTELNALHKVYELLAVDQGMDGP